MMDAGAGRRQTRCDGVIPERLMATRTAILLEMSKAALTALLAFPLGFVRSASIITSNWLSGGEKWTLPLGAQVGRLTKVRSKLPVNFLAGAYYNALQPQFGSAWQLRTQIALIF